MAFKDRVAADIQRVFMNPGHFADAAGAHTWNGMLLPSCVVDNEVALKRKNNNVVDISWDNNRTETLLYIPVRGFPGRLVPNEQILFDGKQMTVSQFHDDMGVYTILLLSNDAKAVAL